MNANNTEIAATTVIADEPATTNDPQDGEKTGPDAPERLSVLASQVRALHGERGLPPVQSWNPPYCGAIDMRIAADGSWHYQGTPIHRPAMVRLFASILRRDRDGYVLVNPVERVGITVDDAPFAAVELERQPGVAGERLIFRTTVDDVVTTDEAHPLRFVTGGDGGLRPYILVRDALWARVSRALALELVEMARSMTHAGREVLCVMSGGQAFALDDDGGCPWIAPTRVTG